MSSSGNTRSPQTARWQMAFTARMAFQLRSPSDARATATTSRRFGFRDDNSSRALEIADSIWLCGPGRLYKGTVSGTVPPACFGDATEATFERPKPRRGSATDATTDPLAQRKRIVLLAGGWGRRQPFLFRASFSRVLGTLISETAISDWVCRGNRAWCRLAARALRKQRFSGMRSLGWLALASKRRYQEGPLPFQDAASP
jgi:hypothetical protein